MAALDGNRIQQALRTKLSVTDRQMLIEYSSGLPDHNEPLQVRNDVSSEDAVN